MIKSTRLRLLAIRVVVMTLLYPSAFDAILHAAAPRYGEAVVVNKVGDAYAYLIDGPVHEGRRKRVELFENTSVGETARVVTGRDGRLCMALSPGAVVCVAPQSQITFQQLRLGAEGLPRNEDDIIRRIHINIDKGRILLHAGVESSSLDIRVETDTGEIRADGGTFAVAQQDDGTWAVFNDHYDQALIPNNGEPFALERKQVAVLGKHEDGNATVWLDDSLAGSPLRQFEVCEVFFNDIEPFFDDPVRFDRKGLARYVGGENADVSYKGGDIEAFDVSPSIRPVPVANVRVVAGETGQQQPGRWSRQKISDWYQDLGPVKGFNYVPRYAVNSVDMWMGDTFDRDIIDQELGWASDAGYTAVRMQLQVAVWLDDPDGFLERFETFLDITDRNGMRVVPVLFDDHNLAGTEPVVGPQLDPLPDTHNSRWIPSPGPSKVQDREQWSDLKAYVENVVKEFGRDDRILFWDMYNKSGFGRLAESSLPLLDQTFNWVRDTEPSQPLAVAAWTRFGSAMTAHMIERSDLVTFQSFDSPQQVEALVSLLQKHNRPVICTDWLMRQNGNDFKSMLPLFANHQIGWFNRGLVNGRTQMWLQQAQYRSSSDPDLWQHDVFRENGDPYSEEEVQQIKAFRFVESDR